MEKDKKLEDEQCELEELQETNSALLINERQSNLEIQEAYNELIRVYVFIFSCFLNAIYM